jgi:hypothetical protein
MKLHGVIAVHVNGADVLRQPRFWDKVKKTFGGEPDLRTGQKRAQLEAQAVVEAARQALRSIDVTNAISLVIDDHVLFQDRDGKPDDLGDLFLAFHDNDSVFGDSFRLLRLAVEHKEAGLHYVAEVVARTEHPEKEAAARVVVSGRVIDLEARSGETAETYRKRVEPLLQDPKWMEAPRRQFEAFVQKLEVALKTSMPEARVELQRAEVRVEKPSDKPKKELAQRPEHPGYDPYNSYYPHPMDGVLSALMWTSIFSYGFGGHNVVVVDADGNDVNDADQADASSDTSDASDAGGGDDWGGGGGDDFGGGDFGGDFGGGDF